MMRFLVTTLSLIGILSSGHARAQPEPSVDPSLIKKSQWDLALAVGLGVKSNPMVKTDDYPLIVLPSIKYYGDNFYFDNGDFGYTLADEAHYSVSLLSRINDEYAHFVNWHPSNILAGVITEANEEPVDGVPPAGGDDEDNPDDPVTDPGPTTPPKLSPQELAKRRISWDAGLQFHYYFTSYARLRLRVLQDISGEHQGQSFNLKWSNDHLVGSGWLLSYSIGFDWLSDELTNYYYGVSERDKVAQESYYQTHSAFQPFARVGARYRINENWNFVSHLYYQKLATTIEQSPLVDESYWVASFVGVNYVF